jgi:hypothetical protein
LPGLYLDEDFNRPAIETQSRRSRSAALLTPSHNRLMAPSRDSAERF